MKASDLFVRCLEEEGVEYVFGVPGEENADFILSLEASDKIKFVLTRHEQGAAQERHPGHDGRSEGHAERHVPCGSRHRQSGALGCGLEGNARRDALICALVAEHGPLPQAPDLPGNAYASKYTPRLGDDPRPRVV